MKNLLKKCPAFPFTELFGPKNRSLVTRLAIRVPVFIALMGLGIACEDGLMASEDKVFAPELNNTSDALALNTSLPHTNVTQLDMPLSVAYELTTYDCSNNPGPNIYLSGVAGTVGFGVRTIFRNNAKGTHQYTDETQVDVALQPDGQQIVIPKPPVLGGTGGNPFIWIQFLNEAGQPIGDEIFIGRCVQGYTFKGAQQVDEQATAYSDYTISGCENSPGPNITFDAGISLAGINAVVIFRNNDNPVGGPHEAAANLSSPLQIIPAGTGFTFPKQPVLGGVGGNPWIWTQFLDGRANVVSDEILLGRCEQLSKALN
jgi:hypothetical protein